MPTKDKNDVNLWFLYLCLQKSDYKTVDYQAVGQAAGLTPHAARMRFSRLKKQIEHDRPSIGESSPASESPTRRTEKISKVPKASGAASPKPRQQKVSTAACISSLAMQRNMFHEAAGENAQLLNLHCRKETRPSKDCHPIYIDLTEDYDNGSFVNADVSSDDEVPLMKKRKTVEMPGLPTDHRIALIDSDGQKPKICRLTRDELPSSTYRLNEEKHSKEHEDSVSGSLTTIASPAEPQVIDLTKDDTAAQSHDRAGTYAAKIYEGYVNHHALFSNEIDIHPHNCDDQDISPFGNELFNSFLSPTGDLRDVGGDDATGWHRTVSSSPRTIFSSAMSLASAEDNYSILDERPAYSQALQRLDHPELAAYDYAYQY